MRVFLSFILGLALIVVPTETHAQQSKKDTLEKMGQTLWTAGWNCLEAVDFTWEEPDHYGDVMKLTCQTETATGQKRKFSFRVTIPKYSFHAKERIEPWK